MALFGDATVRRLRKGPVLVVPWPPELGRLLEVVRLFDPSAAAVEGGITFAAGARLAGPVLVTQEQARRAEVPAGYAFTVSDSGPFQSWLVWGLARRYGGFARPRPPSIVRATSNGGRERPVVPEFLTVHTPRRLPHGELTARLSGYVPGIALDAEGILASPHSPVYVICEGPAAPLLRPLALGSLRHHDDLFTYRFGIDQEPRPQLTRHTAAAALELAHGTGGIVTDCDRFRIVHPDDPALRVS